MYTDSVAFMIMIIVVAVVVVSWYRANMQNRYKNVPTTLPCLPVCLSTYNLENLNRFSSKLTTRNLTKNLFSLQLQLTGLQWMFSLCLLPKVLSTARCCIGTVSVATDLAGYCHINFCFYIFLCQVTYMRSYQYVPIF